MDPIFSSILRPVCQRVIDAAIEEYRLVKDVKEEIKNLRTTVGMIKKVLEDAERKKVEDGLICEWLKSLKQVLFDAEDVLDEIATDEAHGRDAEDGTTKSAVVTRRLSKVRFKLISNVGHSSSSRAIAHRVKDINKKFDDLSKSKDMLGLRVLDVTSWSEIMPSRRQEEEETSMLPFGDAHIVGRDDEMQKIIEILLNFNVDGTDVISVVGMGGVGKTTLVRHVFNSQKVKEHFHTRMWICISHDFDVKRVAVKIIEAAASNSNEAKELRECSNWDVVQNGLRRLIKDKRFLLVLDDVWEENPSKWDSLYTPLSHGACGSKIIVTTRSQVVSNITKGIPIFLKDLSNKELWLILKSYAFDGHDPVKHQQLVILCRQIVDKLKGSPLAARTIGRVLKAKLDERHWTNILSYKTWVSLDCEDSIVANLKLSYDYLPGQLKQCFAYCSLFPDDHEFDKDKLVQLWMAHQFIHLEIMGIKYFDNLVCMSFFGKYTNNDGQKRFVMHDLIHDLADSVSKGDCLRLEDNQQKGTISDTVRHVSIASDRFDPIKIEQLCNKCEKMRTLLFLSGCYFHLDPHLDNIFMKLRRLRVLGLFGCDIKELPASIGTLKHLRFLDLSNNLISKLPESLCYLHNLQVLKLKGCRLLGVLPRNTSALVNLRHLELDTEIASCVPGLRKLTALQELIVNGSKVGELANMGMLKELRIWGLEGVASTEEAVHARLEAKEHLKLLELKWDQSSDNCPRQYLLSGEEVVDALKPVNRIRRLSVRSYEGARSPKWMEDPSWVSTSLLVKVELCDCTKWEVLPPLSQLPCLKFLEISGMSGVKRIGPEFFSCCCDDGEGGVKLVPGFPSLEKLVFGYMSNWEEWESPVVLEQQHPLFLPRLRTLVLHHCEKLRELPPLPPTLTTLNLVKVGLTRLPGWMEQCSDIGRDEMPSTSSSSPSLSTLEIYNCPNITFLDDGLLQRSLPMLKKLRIDGYKELTSLPDGLFRHLPDMGDKAAFGRCFHPFNLDAANVSGSPSVEQGKEEHHDGVGSLKKKDKEKLEEIESFHLEEDREVLFSENTRSEETDLTTRPELIYFPAASGGGTEKSREGEDYSLNGQDRDNQDDKAVMENLEEEGTDSGSRQEGSLTLQVGKESISQEGCSKQTAQEAMGDCEKHQSITDGLIDVESHKEIVSKIRECLQADETRVIGIHGTGGAGKTTLLKMINAEFCSKQNSHFDVVIMVTSLKHYQHKKRVQREIGEQLGLSLLASGPSFLDNLQAAILCQALSQRKFLLILDGVQEMDWDRIGIPLLNKVHKSKIIFATDGFMPKGFKCMENVEVVNMNGLNEFESWELFLRTVTDEAVCEDESIKPLAKQVVAKCDGLPLALILVGRALADKKTTKDWQDALHKMVLLTKDHESGEHFVVHYSLKFSFDYLKNDTLRLCLLYCSLFPENYRISIEELIKYWFGEGLLHDIDIDTAYTTGHTVINELKAAFLLEDGNDKEREVKMHDVVREFALQLTSGANKQSDMFLVHSGVGLSNVPDAEKWKIVTRISLMHNEIELFPSKIPQCSNLSTLLVNRNISLKQMPKDLFKRMPTLCVLDLSSTGIEELPRSIGSLSKLQFLSLSNTYIKTIPKEVGKLVQLRQLDMSSMSGLSDIPQKAISTLSQLQSLNLYNTGQWLIQQPGHNNPRKACIEDLKLLHQLKDLKLTINSLISLRELQNIPSLCRTVKGLSLKQVDGLTSNMLSVILGELERLQVLQVSELSQLKEICFTSHQLQSLEVFLVEHLPQVTFTVAESSDYFFLKNLRHLQIVGCHGFKDLEWIHQLGTLQYLELRICYGVEEIKTAAEVEEEVIKDCSFQKLQTLLLWDLPRLQRISPSSLFLPSLERLEVFHCPKLKELPLTVKSARKLKNIHGHQEWWDGLEWEDQSVKLTLLPHFKDPRNHKEVGDQLGLMGSNH